MLEPDAASVIKLATFRIFVTFKLSLTEYLFLLSIGVAVSLSFLNEIM